MRSRKLLAGLALTLAVPLMTLLATPLVAQAKRHPDERRLKPKIDAAIEAGVEALIRTQQRDGTWGRYGNYDGGKAALCAYALLKSGVPADHPTVRRAMLYLDGVQPKQTYTTACMMLAYAACETKQAMGRVKELSKLLLEWQQKGDYGYPFNHNGDMMDEFGRPDLSNTQYAALGLWIAQRHKVRIPGAVFRRLMAAALRYRGKPELVQTNTKGEHTVTNGGKVAVRGFGYRPGSRPTGSMTTAGVAILQICKLGLGGALQRGRRQIDEAIQQGLAWLGHHFSTNQNPGARNSWHYYYLYGLERVGSLTRVEKMGDHWWFVRGARVILRQQLSDGLWSSRRGHQAVETAFALLFLRRATSITGAAITGRSSGNAGKKKHLFGAGDRFDDAALGGAGQRPLNLWIKSFGVDLSLAHRRHGLRIVQVEYLKRHPVKGTIVIGQVAGDPTKVWKNDSFLARVDNLPKGVHKIRARITAVAPDVAPGQTSPTVTFESPQMRVEIRDVFEKWMEYAAKLSTPKNLLRTQKVTVTATSNQTTAPRVCDGNDGSHWVCAANDERAEITIRLEKAVAARRIILSQAGARGVDRGQFDQILAVEVFLNKDVKPTLYDLDEDQLAVTSIEFPRRIKIRSLRIRIVLRLPGRKAHHAGFSEIGLMKK